MFNHIRVSSKNQFQELWDHIPSGPNNHRIDLTFVTNEPGCSTRCYYFWLCYTSKIDINTLAECEMEKHFMDRSIRVLIAKPGLDGHDRGAKVVARALRDAGMEVIYTGLRQTPEMIAEAALQEDVDVVGLSILSGAHLALVPRVIELIRKNGQADVLVYLGGIIPEEDIPALKAIGVREVYGPGSSTETMAAEIRAAVKGEPVR